jgi:hypothetical protein
MRILKMIWECIPINIVIYFKCTLTISINKEAYEDQDVVLTI